MLLLQVLLIGWTSFVRSFSLSTTHHELSFRRSRPAQSVHSRRSSRTQSYRRDMFSGIVEDIGVVDGLVFNKLLPMWDGTVTEGVELTVTSRKAIEDASIGCSIAVNGVCLTATSLTDNKFTVNLAPETLRRTNLGSLVVGSKVNVERALRADGRNSGHFVQGHVDGTGTLTERWIEGDSLWMRVYVAEDVLKYIVPKGFICIDGTSLTVCDVVASSEKDTLSTPVGGWFTVMLVSHTQQNVVFPLRNVGDKVNIEVDIIGKLVERSLAGNLAVFESTVSKLRTDIIHRDVDVESLKQIVGNQSMTIQMLNQRVQDLEENVRSLGNILS